ncbi:MAG: S41 family peptidase [Allosphingosinicella sp.]
MRRIVVVMGAGAVAVAAAAVAQTAQPAGSQAAAAQAEAPFDARQAVAEVRRLIAENYVLPERRATIDAALAESLAAGRYDVDTPQALAERINADLERAGKDKHLNISFDPAQAAMLRSGGSDGGPDEAQFERLAAARNHGLTEMKVLDGNIRYLAVDGFMWAGAKSAAAYDDAMRFLKGGDAAIIDIRRNGGGSPHAVQYLISHFMEPDRHIVTFHMRGDENVDTLSTLKDLPAGRMVGKPLYVLASGRSASAAEEFAGHIAGFKVGELIGETTAGAGFRNDLYPIPGGLVLSVSVGRAVLASTGKDWEAVGIAPTLAVAPEKALDVAHGRAARRLAATATGRDKALLEGLAAVLAAKADPVAPALPLAAYAGRFGERQVTVEDGKLMFQRDGGPKMRLLAVGPNLFAFADGDPLTRVRYEVAGTAAPAFELIRGDGSRVRAARSE